MCHALCAVKVTEGKWTRQLEAQLLGSKHVMLQHDGVMLRYDGAVLLHEWGYAVA